MGKVLPFKSKGIVAKSSNRTNYDTVNGGAPIKSINGATKKGQSGYHDPYQKPPDGFADWHAVGEHNKSVLDEAGRRSDMLRAAGYRYDSSNGTWVGPNGDRTTLFAADPGPPGVSVSHWDGPQDHDYEDYDDDGGDYGSGEARWGQPQHDDDRWGT